MTLFIDRHHNGKIVAKFALLNLSIRSPILIPPHTTFAGLIKSINGAHSCSLLLESYYYDIWKTTKSPILRGIRQGLVLGPLVFNIFFKYNFFCFVREVSVKLCKKYRWYTELCNSNKDPVILGAILQKGLGFADKWLANNGMIASARKYQAIVSGSATHTFQITANDF